MTALPPHGPPAAALAVHLREDGGTAMNLLTSPAFARPANVRPLPPSTCENAEVRP